MLADGQLGTYQSNARLTIDDVTDIFKICIDSKTSLFDSGNIGNPATVKDTTKTTHYATAIEWLEAAEM